MLSPNTILRERYRIIHQLGHGGMGAVYQAMDENLSCVVAVKETFATTDEQRRAFRREAELLANLSHPTLPRVMDHFTHDDGQFLVMQFVPGHDLAELLELREQPFQVTKVLDWADQIFDALEELHSSNPPIVHRDIKPSNLKVTPRGRILLLDFGLAKGAAGQMSTADVDSHGKSIYGYTPNYAPIEQIRGAGTDARSDLYALAATLWTLLTGRVPPDAVTRMAEKEEGNPDPLRAAHELNSQVPAAVSGALNRAMAVNRNQRFSSAAEFRQVLRDAGEAKFESPTRQKEERVPAEPVRSRPGSLDPTIRTPEPTQPPPPAVGPTDWPPEPRMEKPAPSEPRVPTMRVDSPPVVPTREVSVSAPTDGSRPFADYKQSKSWHLPVLVAAGALLAAILGIGLAVWQPWASTTTNQTANADLANNQTNASSTNTASPAAPPGMVYVPGGEFTMGRNDGDEAEQPAHKVTVKPFYMDINEVTRSQYQNYVGGETGRPAPANWRGRYFPDGTGNWPVTGVTWDEANAYCKWLQKLLPAEEQWEFAARGPENRIYPWGNDWRDGNANANGAKQSIANVGEYKGASPFGTLDMIGNAWEWTASAFRSYPGGQLPSGLPSGELKVIRGGSYESTKEYATATYRGGWPARGASDYSKTGFRCVKAVR